MALLPIIQTGSKQAIKLHERFSDGLIPFRLNNSAYDVLIMLFTFSVGGASCPADFARRQGFLLCSTQVSLLNPRNQCTCILEKWYKIEVRETVPRHRL